MWSSAAASLENETSGGLSGELPKPVRIALMAAIKIDQDAIRNFWRPTRAKQTSIEFGQYPFPPKQFLFDQAGISVGIYLDFHFRIRVEMPAVSKENWLIRSYGMERYYTFPVSPCLQAKTSQDCVNAQRSLTTLNAPVISSPSMSTRANS